MVLTALNYLTDIAIILLVGIIIALISNKINISKILLLLIAGLIISKITYYGEKLFQFPPIFITSLALLALVMIVFDSTSRFKWKEFDVYTLKALKLTIIFLIMNLLFLSIATALLFDVKDAFILLIFSSIMVGTSPDVVLSQIKETKYKVVELLKIESILNTPLTVLLPFIILSLKQTLPTKTIILSEILNQLKPFTMQFVTGIGAGVLIGLILSKFMRKRYSETLSPLALFTAALMTYILAEQLGGNGVLAVSVMGLFFGNIYIKQKEQLYSFSSVFGNSLLILVFILIGIGTELPFESGVFWLKSSALFFIYLIIRYVSVALSVWKENYSPKEKIFLTLMIPKGIGVAVVVFTLGSYALNIIWLNEMLQIVVVFMLYSIVFSTIVSKFLHKFLKTEHQKVNK